jgi:hypothetical protein
LRKPVIAAIVLFVCIANVFVGSGIWLVKYPPGHNIFAFMYGFGIFFFGFLPFIVEGGVLLGLAKVPQSKIDELCEDKSLMEKNSGKNKLLNEFMIFAHNYDHHSENVLDHMMCTDTCPCYYEVRYNENES